MGRLAQWLGLETRAAVVVTSADSALDWLGAPSAAGVPVSPQGSLASTAVMACVQLIARSLASVPLVLYRRGADSRSREPATDHPLYPLLHDLSNPLQTSFEVRESLFAQVLLYGNAYAEIEWSPDGFPAALWPLPADRVGVEMTPDRALVYSYYSDSFGMVRLPAWRVHHVRGLSLAGVVGLSPIRSAMNAVGLTLATESYGGQFFAQGARPSLVLAHPAKLTPEAMRNLRQSFEVQWSGLSNAHRIAVVGEGVKPDVLSVPPNEAQFLETRGFQVREVCRLFGVAPGMVGEGDTATYASAEQDMLRFRELTLGPWAERHEKAMLRDLLTPAERASMFVKYRLDKLQATDLATRYNTFMVAKQAGILTTNEIREMEDYNPVEGGDELWMPLNMAPASDVEAQAQQPQPNMDGQDGQDRAGEGANVVDAWVADVQRRLAARVANDVRQQGLKALRHGGTTGLADWGEAQRTGWAQAGEEMLQPLAGAGVSAPGATVIGEWVTQAHLAAVREIVG